MKKTIRSFGYAVKGIIEMVFTQGNARIHLAALISAIAMGVLFDIHPAEWLWLCAAGGLVLMAEAFNTSIEYLCDIASPGYSEKAGKVKDLAAGAVLLSALTAAAIGAIIFIPKLITIFSAFSYGSDPRY